MRKVELTERSLLIMAQGWRAGDDATEPEAAWRKWLMRYGAVMSWCVFCYSSGVDRIERAGNLAW